MLPIGKSNESAFLDNLIKKEAGIDTTNNEKPKETKETEKKEDRK